MGNLASSIDLIVIGMVTVFLTLAGIAFLIYLVRLILAKFDLTTVPKVENLSSNDNKKFESVKEEISPEIIAAISGALLEYDASKTWKIRRIKKVFTDENWAVAGRVALNNNKPLQLGRSK